MYGLVLATVMTVGVSSPDFHRRGCCGCCGYSSCYGCCGCYGGYGCCGCSGCYGCYGCYGGSGCCGCYGGYGCCGYVPMVTYAAPSCYGCYGGCYGGGCYGCGGYVSAAPTYGVPAAPMMMPAPDSKSIEKGMVMQSATVVVKAATNVTIKVNGQATTRRTNEETYTTPALDPSKTYSYVFTAEQTADGKTRTVRKEVTVAAGKKTVVDFTNLDAAVAGVESESAKLTIVLPGQGKLFVNNVEVSISGKKTFITPALVAGQRYYYTVKAELVKDGTTKTETRRVNIEAGKSVTVDFSAPAVQTASR